MGGVALGWGISIFVISLLPFDGGLDWGVKFTITAP